jgi:hypothetical protein
MWIKNTNKKPDAMLTFAGISFAVVTLNMFLSSFQSITVGETTVLFQALDGSVMAVYLGATFTAYVSRRWTDKKYGGSEAPAEMNPMLEVAKTIVEEVVNPSEPQPAEVALSQIEQAGPPAEDVTEPTKKRRTKRDPQ